MIVLPSYHAPTTTTPVYNLYIEEATQQRMLIGCWDAGLSVIHSWAAQSDKVHLLSESSCFPVSAST